MLFEVFFAFFDKNFWQIYSWIIIFNQNIRAFYNKGLVSNVIYLITLVFSF